MNKKEVIVNVVNNNPDPDPNYCPKLICYWKGNAQKYGGEYTNFYIPTTGQKFINQLPSFIHAEEGSYVRGHSDYPSIVELKTTKLNENHLVSNIVLMRFGTTVERNDWTYIKYHHEYDMLEIAPIYMDGGVSKPDKSLNIDIRKWKFSASSSYGFPYTRLFLFKDDAHIYDKSGNEWNHRDYGKYYDRSFVKHFTDIDDCYHNCTDKNLQELSDFVSGTKNSHDCIYPYNFIENYYKKIGPRNTSKKSKKKIDNINDVSISLTNVEKITSKYPFEIYKTEESVPYGTIKTMNYTQGVIAADVIKDDVYLQVFHRNYGEVKAFFNTYCTDDKVHKDPANGYWATAKPPIIHINNKNGNVGIYTYNKSENKYVMSGISYSDIYDSIKHSYGSKVTIETTFGSFESLGGKIKEAYEIVKNSKEFYTEGYRYKPNYDAVCKLEMIIDILKHQSILDAYNKGYKNLASGMMYRMDGIAHNSLYNFGRQNNNSTAKSIEKMMEMNPEQLELLNNNTKDDTRCETAVNIAKDVFSMAYGLGRNFNITTLTLKENESFTKTLKGMLNLICTVSYSWRDFLPAGCYSRYDHTIGWSGKSAAEDMDRLLKVIADDKTIIGIIFEPMKRFKRGKTSTYMNPYRDIVDKETATKFAASCK